MVPHLKDWVWSQRTGHFFSILLVLRYFKSIFKPYQTILSRMLNHILNHIKPYLTILNPSNFGPRRKKNDGTFSPLSPRFARWWKPASTPSTRQGAIGVLNHVVNAIILWKKTMKIIIYSVLWKFYHWYIHNIYIYRCVTVVLEKHVWKGIVEPLYSTRSSWNVENSKLPKKILEH